MKKLKIVQINLYRHTLKSLFIFKKKMKFQKMGQKIEQN